MTTGNFSQQESMVYDRPSKKERFLTALTGGQPDYIPLFEFPCSQNLFEHVLGHRPDTYNSPDVIELSLKLGLDGTFIPYGGFKGYSARIDQILDEHTMVDEWGTTYKDTGTSWPMGSPIAYPISCRQDLAGKKFPDPTLPSRLDDIRLALELSKDRVAVVGGINGPLTVAQMLTGFETLMMSLYTDPSFVDDLLKIGFEYYQEGIRRMIDAGVDAICIAEDMGYATGLYMSPAHFRRHIFPLLEELIEQTKGRGVSLFLHCDGNINTILDDLVEMGINGLHPIERKANMDIISIKKKYGNRLCLIGNVDATYTLCSGSPDDVQTEVIELVRTVAPGGAYVLASDSDLRDDMPVENILAMIDAGKKYGKYPINSAGLEA